MPLAWSQLPRAHTRTHDPCTAQQSALPLLPLVPGPANRICKHDFALSVNSDNGNGGNGGLGRRISAPQAPRDADWTPATTMHESRAPIPPPLTHSPPEPARLPWKSSPQLRGDASADQVMHSAAGQQRTSTNHVPPWRAILSTAARFCAAISRTPAFRGARSSHGLPRCTKALNCLSGRRFAA